MPAHQAVGSVAKCLANAQRCPENDRTSDIWAGNLQGGIKTMWGFSCDFPDLRLLVCGVSLHVLGTPIPVLGLELRWGSVLTHSPIPIPYNLLPEA